MTFPNFPCLYADLTSPLAPPSQGDHHDHHGPPTQGDHHDHHGPPNQGDHGREQARSRGVLNSGRSGRVQVGGLIAGMKKSDLIIIDDETP